MVATRVGKRASRVAKRPTECGSLVSTSGSKAAYASKRKHGKQGPYRPTTSRTQRSILPAETERSQVTEPSEPKSSGVNSPQSDCAIGSDSRPRLSLEVVWVDGPEGRTLAVQTPWSRTPTPFVKAGTVDSRWAPLRDDIDDDLTRGFEAGERGAVQRLAKTMALTAMLTNPHYSHAISSWESLPSLFQLQAQPSMMQRLFFGEPSLKDTEMFPSLQYGKIPSPYQCTRRELYAATWSALGTMADDPQFPIKRCTWFGGLMQSTIPELFD